MHRYSGVRPVLSLREPFRPCHAQHVSLCLFAMVLGQLDTHGVRRRRAGDRARAAHGHADPAGATPPAAVPLDHDVVPATLREIEMPTGCAADYDGWLAEAV